jgi:hypothetical protein
VFARYRRAALALAPAVLIAGALSALVGTADARTPTSADAHSSAQAHASAEAHAQQTQQCHSSASPAACGFASEIQLPLSVSVTAAATPESGQSATVTWTVSCSVNGGSAASSSGSRSGTTPFHVQLTMPKSESGDCTVNESSRLSGSGALTGTLAYTLGAKVMIGLPTGDTRAGAPLAFYMCLRDAKQGHTTGAHAILGTCSSVYVGAWTYNGKTLVHGGLCLTDPRNGRSGTKLLLERCTGAADQTWTYRISNTQAAAPFVLKSPHLCLDDPKYTKVVNTPLTVHTCDGGPDEQWALSA